ncbi:type IV secretion system DNA-binding domain-containing protein [Mariprofundus ferrooxydans]|uniref:type IV secretion system DNA-binding domain-containing protein n=1 Tax=Mariprofundus ferrooxydans TaxID=314344 RepID=UPI0014322845|nr:type IV secretion system DNA-binding domain-containing protein [Mariprofundus ferrooxydans]
MADQGSVENQNRGAMAAVGAGVGYVGGLLSTVTLMWIAYMVTVGTHGIPHPAVWKLFVLKDILVAHFVPDIIANFFHIGTGIVGSRLELGDAFSGVSRYALASGIIFLPPLFPAFLLAQVGWSRAKKDVHIEVGEAVERDPDAALAAFKKALGNADGIRLHADFSLPRHRETEHILLAGGTGAGKTQALSHAIDSVIDRGDKAIIFDVKGDYSSQMVSESAEERKSSKTYLIAPWDTRSAQWNVAKDITGRSTAKAFAESFIQKSGRESNPFFIDAARSVLAGILLSLIEKHGKNWGWGELTHTLADPQRMKSALDSIGHQAAQHIQIKQDGSVGTTSASVLSTLANSVEPLFDVAESWPQPGVGVSLTAFVNASGADGAKLILASRPSESATATPLIAGMLGLLISKTLSLPDSSDRRIFFILDELGALPKIESLTSLITLGRSKGLCLIAGIQDMGRIQKLYGREEAGTIASQFGTHIIGRLGDAETARWACEVFGTQRIKSLQQTHQQVAQRQSGDALAAAMAPTEQTSRSWQAKDRAVLVDADFLHLQKASKDGFFMWIKTSDASGHMLAGKVHYEINPTPTPYPACVLIDSDDYIYNNADETAASSAQASPETGVADREARLREAWARDADAELAGPAPADDVTTAPAPQVVKKVELSPEKAEELAPDAGAEAVKAGAGVAINGLTGAMQDAAVDTAGHAVGLGDGSLEMIHAASELADTVQAIGAAAKTANALAPAPEPGESQPQKKKIRFKKKAVSCDYDDDLGEVL